jgi:ABC-type sugar transport system permease subunit
MKPKWKISPYLYILPAFIILLAFRLIPIIMSFIISFYDWSIQGTGKFIGLANYSTMMKDPVFWQSMLNTFWLVIIQLPQRLYSPMLLPALEPNQAVQSSSA